MSVNIAVLRMLRRLTAHRAALKLTHSELRASINENKN